MEATEVDIRGSSPSVRWDVSARLREHVDRDQWFEIVNRFGARQITFAKDRLPAIAAMARVYGASEYYRDYVAGLWLSHLHNALLWVTDTPKCTKTSSAPSWSWASVHRPDPAGGRSQWFYTPLVYRVRPAPTWEVLQVSVGLVSADPYGPVLPGGFLSMSGLYLEVCKCRIPSLCFDEFERSPGDECVCWSDIQGECPMHWAGVVHVAMDTLFGCLGEEDLSHTKLAMVYVGKSLMWRPDGKAQDEFAWCLLLEPRGVESYNFTRVGSITFPYGTEDAWKNWRQQEVSIF
ncbi:hypothetical protein C8A01DRAFT_34449 [Parachaetomium inaequale]|uniref:Uncharacterized protein n=1 Tax=Parachaetomium inaequale TaxID=2588326 RepID=A0AAN6ST16_9PEZI|nr:hypothetical protein C8A01DRAFT_34449 [Parachaetomium inaequale]